MNKRIRKTNLGQKPIRDADQAIWDHVRAGVTPLRRRFGTKITQESDPKAQRATLERAPHGTGMIGNAPKSSNAPGSLVPNQQGSLRRSLARAKRRGNLEPSARLDLHGRRLDDARTHFEGFILDSARRGHRLVLVITGKGSAGAGAGNFGEPRGIIRQSLPGWAISPSMKRLITHYCEAHPKHGGAGAFYIFLRAREKRKGATEN